MRIEIVNGLQKYKDQLFPIVQALAERGGIAYLVGGCVRDMVLNLPLKDLDIEVHNMELDALHDVLRRFGHVEEVGKKFGVLLLLGLAIDWSLPRSDSSGRKPHVILQPQLDIKQALQRRDLTMNAMAINLTTVVCEGLQEITTHDIIDPFGGLRDIAANQMRAVDDAFFVQDPLRLLRVMQFAGRFGMAPTPELDALCARMPLYDTYDDRPLARERIQSEVVKLLLLAPQPSVGFAWLMRISRAEELFPFLKDNPEALPVIDRLAPHVQACSTDEQVMLFLTALSYRPLMSLEAQQIAAPQDERVFDFNLDKEMPDHPEEDRRSVSKEMSGNRMSNKNLLINCTDSHKTIKAVEVILQIIPQLKNLSDDAAGLIAIKKIAAQLAAVQTSLALVSKLSWCLFESTAQAVEQSLVYCVADRAGVLNGPEEALVQGRDLLNQIPPGPELGRLVALAYQLQLEESVRDKQALIERLMAERGA